jgi:DNA invertase Pin-like site-specific DNA recombinase
MSDPKVYSYMRFSDPRQATGTSSARQMAYATAWARERGLPLDTSLTLRDEGLSAYHQRHVKRGALGVFLAAVEAGTIAPGSYLVVEGLDRLSRAEPIQAQAQLAQIINAGITVVTAADNRQYSRETLKAQPMDLVYSLLVMIRAHEESETKSKRVLSAIRQQCKAWEAGTWRGLVVNGKDPSWCKREGTTWVFVPERHAAVLYALDMFQKGYGAVRIVRAMVERDLALTDGGPAALQIYRLIRQRALTGTKELTVAGETFHLHGYYPAVLSEPEWLELQALADTRGRRRVKGELPHVITGLGITLCGYCGTAMVGQTNSTKKRLPDGRIRESHRRLHCVSKSQGAGCKVTGSISEAPVERAIIAHCSDMLNLQALYGSDRTATPRAELVKVQQRLSAVDSALERVAEALVSSDSPPQTFLSKARSLEREKADLKAQAATLERELAAASRTGTTDADARWQALALGVEQQDFESRLQARQLVADTFAKIVIYRKGVRPAKTPAGLIDLLLLAKGGVARLLRIDSQGAVLSAEDVDTTKL